MLAEVRLLPNAVSELFAQSSHSGYITLADRYGLMAALLEDSLNDEERRSIDRLLRAISRGHVRVVDELSALQ
jgi:hypothetical protein